MGADQASGLEESLHLRIQIRPTYTPPSSLVGLHHHLVLQMSDAATWDYHPGSAGRNSVCQGRVLVTSPSHPPSQSDSLIIHGSETQVGLPRSDLNTGGSWLPNMGSLFPLEQLQPGGTPLGMVPHWPGGGATWSSCSCPFYPSDTGCCSLWYGACFSLALVF